MQSLLYYTVYQDITMPWGRVGVTQTHVSIGRVKRDISDLVNRVAYGGERIVLTSRGKPKAAIVSIDDYRLLEQGEVEGARARWKVWLEENRELAADILARVRDGHWM